MFNPYEQTHTVTTTTALPSTAMRMYCYNNWVPIPLTTAGRMPTQTLDRQLLMNPHGIILADLLI